LIAAASTAVAKREALQRSAPVLLSALSLEEARDRLYTRPVAGLSFPRRFVVVCRSLASLARQDRDFADFIRRRRSPGRIAARLLITTGSRTHLEPNGSEGGGPMAAPDIPDVSSPLTRR
jgi:hypothetical protein